MANFIMGIISLSIGVVIMSAVFISTVVNTNQTYGNNNSQTWTTSEIALWGLLSIVGIAGLLYGVLNVFGIA